MTETFDTQPSQGERALGASPERGVHKTIILKELARVGIKRASISGIMVDERGYQYIKVKVSPDELTKASTVLDTIYGARVELEPQRPITAYDDSDVTPNIPESFDSSDLHEV